MINLIEAKLSDVCTKVTDGTHDTPKKVNLGIPLIKAKEIIEGKISFKNTDLISKTDHEIVIARSNPEYGDTLFAHIGASMGAAAFIDTKQEFSIKNIALFKPNREIINDRYLFYLVLSPQFQQLAIKSRTGSAQPFLSLGHLRNHSILYHKSLLAQQKIASVLTVYDKLIDNNTRQIEILEEMAQRIYKEWFIEFKYPGHENDELVDSELGMIPESWELNNLDKYVSFDRGTEPGSKNYQDNKSENTIPFLRVGDLGSRNKNIYIPKELAKEKILDKKDIVITLDGTVGIVKTGLEGCFSTGLRKCRIINNSINREFLFYTLKSRNIQSTIKAHATGSTILHASSSIKHMKFALPINKIMNNFFEMLNPIITEKQILTDKNYNLSKTRDYLLPKLISGKVDVSDLDIDTSILDD